MLDRLAVYNSEKSCIFVSTLWILILIYEFLCAPNIDGLYLGDMVINLSTRNSERVWSGPRVWLSALNFKVNKPVPQRPTWIKNENKTLEMTYLLIYD